MCGSEVAGQRLPQLHTTFKRVRTRVAAVAVVVRVLLFLVTSMICARIRGLGSEVTTNPDHIRSDFRQKRRSYHNGFVSDENGGRKCGVSRPRVLSGETRSVTKISATR